jgi:hypothetical protein
MFYVSNVFLRSYVSLRNEIKFEFQIIFPYKSPYLNAGIRALLLKHFHFFVKENNRIPYETPEPI